MGKAAKSAGVGFVAAAAAGAYFFFGKDGESNRKKIKGWAVKAKGEVLDKLEDLKTVNKKNYDKIVDEVTKKYKKVKKASGPEIKKLNKQLKSAWGKIKNKIA